MEKSLVVTGRSLERALDKATLLLHCAKETIAYETLREGLPAVRGHDAVTWKIKATPVAPALDDTSTVPSPDTWDADTPLAPEWPTWAALTLPEFLARLTAALTELAPLPPPDVPLTQRLGTERTIRGDVGRGQETLRHDGPLRIEGNVRRGARVSAETIYITGDVETAVLETPGNITIEGGLLGTAHSQTGDVRCRFAQGARLTATAGSVWVQESAMHSHLRAGQAVRVGGILLGGTAYGEELVEVDTAGSPSGVPTLLTAGRNARLHNEAAFIRAEAARVVARLGELTAVRKSLLTGSKVLSPAERALLWQTMTRTVRAHEHLQVLGRHKNAALEQINAEHGSRVCVAGRAFPKVRVTVDDAASELDIVTQFAVFSKDYDAGSLRVTPFR